MISYKGEYEEPPRGTRVECKKFPLFLPDFGAILYYFQGIYCGQQSISGEVWRFTTNEGDCKNVTEPFWGGGEGGIGLCEVHRDSQNLSSDPTFRPWHLTHSHSVGKRDLLWPTEYKGRSEVYKTSEKNIMVL